MFTVVGPVASRRDDPRRSRKCWLKENLLVAAALSECGYDFRLVVGDGGHDGNHGGVILPDALRLPLVEQMANADSDEFFADADLAEVERDMRAELLAVRTRIAQGLPVVGRWLVVGSDGEVSSQGRDATAYLWWLQRGEERKPVTVFISRTAMASSNEHLPEEVAAAKNTRGRSVLSQVVGLDDPPTQVSVTTAGIRFGLPD